MRNSTWLCRIYFVCSTSENRSFKLALHHTSLLLSWSLRWSRESLQNSVSLSLRYSRLLHRFRVHIDLNCASISDPIRLLILSQRKSDIWHPNIAIYSHISAAIALRSSPRTISFIYIFATCTMYLIVAVARLKTFREALLKVWEHYVVMRTWYFSVFMSNCYGFLHSR